MGLLNPGYLIVNMQISIIEQSSIDHIATTVASCYIAVC